MHDHTLPGVEPSYNLGQHRATVGIGFMARGANTSRVKVGGITLEGNSSIAGWLGYGYWFDEDWAFQVETGWISAHANMLVIGAGASANAAAVVPLLAGARYQPDALAIGSVARAYVAALAGPYFGFSSRIGAFPALVESAPTQP